MEVVLTNDAFDGSHPRAQASPLDEPPVLAGTHEVLASPVMRMLVEDPVSAHHVAGVDVSGAKVFVEGGNVFGQLHHLPPELGTLVQHHFVSDLALRKNGFP